MKRRKRFVTTAVLLIGILSSIGGAESSLSWRVFNKNENTWIYYPKGLMLFSTLTRTVKPVSIDATRRIDTLTDCIVYDDYLWVSSNAGLYQIDMASQSVERIPFPVDDSTSAGKIGQDMDYLWFVSGRSLWQFDKLGREWFEFPLPETVESPIGLWSNGDEVFCLGRSILFRFTTSTEKWNRYPLDTPLSGKAIFYPGTETFKVIDGNRMLLYQPGSFSWVKTDLGETPVDLFDNGNEIYTSDGSKVRQINCETGMIRPLNIPNVGGIQAITVAGDSVMMVMKDRVAAFSVSQETVNITEYENDFVLSDVQKILPLQPFLVLITGKKIIIYEKVTKAWQYIPRTGMQQKVKVFSWNEEECALRYGGGYQTTLSGNLEIGEALQAAGYEYDTTGYRTEIVDGLRTRVPVVDSELVLNFSRPSVYGQVNMHTADKNDRVADLFFDNTSFSTTPKKGLYYRGNRDDYLNTLRLGTTNNKQMASAVLPQVSMEGGTVVLDSRKKLEKRDRKVARVTGGGGYVTSRTITRKLPYRADGTYYLLENEGDSTVRSGTAIIPGTIKVLVDGAVIDTTYYTLYTSTGKLEFNTSAPIDPVSSLTAEYQVQPLPDDEKKITDVEFIPSSHFGKLYYGNFTLSPTEWISARVGYTGIDRDSLHSIISAAIPLELRSERAKLMVKATPEFSYDATNNAKAGGVTMQSRLGSSTGLLFNGRYIDSNFVSTDTLTQGIGALRKEYDVTLYHDIRQELPQSYYQHQRFSDLGSENRYEFKSGVHFTGFPFLDLTASRTLFEKIGGGEEANVFDSLFTKKDKLHFRLYETSSPFLQKLTRFKKISYELGHSEYRSLSRDESEWNHGRVSTLQFTLMPIQRIIMLGEMLYRGSVEIEGAPTSDIAPRLSFQMVDFPKGIDLSGLYSVNYKNFGDRKMSTDTLVRMVNVVLKPGQWFAPLGWFSPRAQISQHVQSSFASVGVPVWDMLTGANGERNAEIVKEVGVNIFPTDGILLTNTNRWVESSRKETVKYQSINRLQLLFDARNIVTSNYNVSLEGENSSHNLLAYYEKIWSGWLRTSPAVLFNAKTDSTGNTISSGPKFTLNLNFKDIGIIRMLSNIHEFQAGWNRVNGELHSEPDISYNFTLRLNLRPNLELSNIEKLQFKEGKFADFLARLILSIYF